MPNQYENPDIKPCTGSYTWVPETPVNFFGGVNPTVGFQNLIIDRGAFRNYYLRPNLPAPQPSSPTVTTKNSTEGDLYNPIINSTRPLAVNGAVKASNNENLVVRASGGNENKNADGYVDFLQFDFPTNDAFRRLSCVKVEYDLSFFFGDENFNASNFELNPTQLRSLDRIKNGNLEAAGSFIAGLKPPVLALYGVETSGSEKLIGEVPFTRARSEIDETSLIYASETESALKFQTINVKTLEELLDRNKFPQFKSVKFKIRAEFSASTVVLVLKKIAFFTADRVNFRYIDKTNQLPCAALGYSMFINGTFYPILAYASLLGSGGGSVVGTGGVDGSGAFTWPQDNRLNGCNVHVKLFNPDFITGSPGFAHSLNLRLYIFSFPFFGPFGSFLLPGVNQPYFGVIIGPTPFNQQLIFYGNSNFNPTSANLAVMNSAGFRQNTKSVILSEKSQPTNISRMVFSYPDGVENATRNQFYYEVQGIGTSFQNIFVSESGVQTFSGVYPGTIPRNNTAFLEASLVPALKSRTQRRDFIYNTYVFKKKPSLYKLFTESNPFLIFKCSNPDGYSDSTFQQPGFISASVDGFIKDPAQIFNTQLVYRIYAVQKNTTDLNPNNDYSLRYCLKIINSGKEDSTIEFTNFDKQWDFTNTLVTGNLSDKLQNISVAEIINTDKRSFKIADGEFDLYCAIYSMSVLVDNQYELYKTSNLNSFDLPAVTLAIQNNFVLTFPIFYKKSAKNGGNLQAQRDFGATGEYLKDNRSYFAVNQFFDGRPFDNTSVYKNKLSSSSGYLFLLKMVGPSELSGKSTSIILESVANETVQVDFVIDFESLSYSRVGPGSWRLTLVSTQLEDVSFKYDVVLVNSNDYSFILNIAKSKFQKAKTKEQPGENGESIGEISIDINVPFYLPSTESKAILKLYFNKDATTTLTFDKIELTENTIEYFQFKNRLPNSAPFGFYEDLPIQPSSFGSGCSDFILKLDLDPSQPAVIYDSIQGLRINGCLYSPTWAVDLPEKMELDYRGVINDSLLPRATGVRPYQIFFRTGLPNNIIAIDTKRHGGTGLVMTTFNKETNVNDFAVRQTVSEGYLRYASFNNFMTTANADKTLTDLNLQNPTLTRTNQIIVGGQISGNEQNNSGILNAEAPGFFANQPSADGQYIPFTGSTATPRLTGCILTTYAYRRSEVFIAGVTPEGGLLFSQQPLTTVAGRANSVLIEGPTDTSSELLALLGATRFSEPLQGSVTLGYPGLYANTQGCIVFYTYSSKAKSDIVKKGSCIYSIYLGDGLPAKPAVVFDFKEYCAPYGDVTQFPEITNITVCNHDVYPRGNELYLAFTCLRKVFIAKLILEVSIVLCVYRVVSVVAVYGNLTSSSSPDETKFIKTINNAIGQSAIFRFSPFDYNKNLESNQRVGFVDYDGVHLGVQFKDGNEIKEVIFDKSCTIPGQIRKIADA